MINKLKSIWRNSKFLFEISLVPAIGAGIFVWLYTLTSNSTLKLVIGVVIAAIAMAWVYLMHTVITRFPKFKKLMEEKAVKKWINSAPSEAIRSKRESMLKDEGLAYVLGTQGILTGDVAMSGMGMLGYSQFMMDKNNDLVGSLTVDGLIAHEFDAYNNPTSLAYAEREMTDSAFSSSAMDTGMSNGFDSSSSMTGGSGFN